VTRREKSFSFSSNNETSDRSARAFSAGIFGREPQLSAATSPRSRTETVSRSGHGDIPPLDEHSWAKVDSIREIARMERSSRDGDIQGDVLRALVLEVSAHVHGREQVTANWQVDN
jgi:hypothetical protein